MMISRATLFCAGLICLTYQTSRAQEPIDNPTLTLQEVAKFDFPGGAVETIASSPDQKWLCVGWSSSAEHRGGAQIVDAVTFKPGPVLDIGRGGSNSDAEFTADSKYLVTLSFAKVLRIWDTATGKLVGQGSKPSWDWQLSCHPNNKECISTGGQSEIRRWEIPTGKLLSETDSGFARIIGLELSRDGKTLVLLGRSNQSTVSLQIRSYPDLKVIHERTLVSGTGLHSQIAITPDGRHLAYTLSGGEGNVSVVDVQSGKIVRLVAAWMTRCNDLKFLNNHVLISHGWRRAPRILDIQSGETVALVGAAEVGGSGMAVNSVGGIARLLLGHAGGEAKTVSVWRLPPGLAEMKFEHTPTQGIAVAMSPKPSAPDSAPAPIPVSVPEPASASVPMTSTPAAPLPSTVANSNQPRPLVSVAKSDASGRLPIPDAETARNADAKIRDLLKIPSQGTVDESLPKRISELAEEEDDTNIRYSMLTIASQLAVRIGDVDALRSALELLDKKYQFDRLLVAGRLLSDVRTASMGVKAKSKFAAYAEDLGNESLAEEEIIYAAGFYDLAIRWTQRDPDKLRERRTKATRVKKMMVEFRRAVPAKDRLDQSPQDPDACQIWGSYLCFVRGNWETGLPLLARSNDAKLKEVAANDLKAGEQPAMWLKVAAAWQEVAQTQADGTAKTGAYVAARYWYEKSAEGLKGFGKLQAKAALKKLPKADDDLAAREN